MITSHNQSSNFAQALSHCPLIVSVQASEGSAMENPSVLLACARASLAQGVKVLRLQGVEIVETVRRETGALVIGLLKRRYPDSEVYITPTMREVEELIETGCEAIALDGTLRPRPGNEKIETLIERIRAGGRLVLLDIDNEAALAHAIDLGADLVGTTLSGYTAESSNRMGPDLELVRRFDELKGSNAPLLLAEGRFTEKWQIEAALRMGANSVVVGGAINDPVKNTRRLLPSERVEGTVAAIDIGGTWLRGAVFTEQLFDNGDLGAVTVERTPLPPKRQDRMDWISAFIQKHGVSRVGVSTGGVVRDNVVTISKNTIPENVGTDYNTLAGMFPPSVSRPVIAIGDGAASAWVHACHPQFAGKNIAVLALGTGVGFGLVREGRLVTGPNGEYTRVNDILSSDGERFEVLLGGRYLTPTPSEEQMRAANIALQEACAMIATFLFPDAIVLCGTVGMQPWLNLHVPIREGFVQVPILRSPFGNEAGIFGAAATALFPPPA